MRKRKIRQVIVLSLIFPAGIMLWLFYSLIREGADISHQSIPEFSNLFTKETQDKLQTPITFRSKIRQVETNYLFGKNFHVTVSKVILTEDKSLKNIILEKDEPASKDFDVFSEVIDNSHFSLIQYSNKIELVSDLDFTYAGDSINTLAKNDSLYCFYLAAKTFSIAFNGGAAKGFWGGAKGTNKMPLCVAFIKKKKNLYFIVLASNDGENKLEPNLLYQMIQK